MPKIGEKNDYLNILYISDNAKDFGNWLINGMWYLLPVREITFSSVAVFRSKAHVPQQK